MDLGAEISGGLDQELCNELNTCMLRDIAVHPHVRAFGEIRRAVRQDTDFAICGEMAEGAE